MFKRKKLSKMTGRQRKQKMSPIKKAFIYTAVFVLVLAVSYAGYIGVSAYQALQQMQDVSHEVDEHGEEEIVERTEKIEKMVREGNTVSILIAGVDSEAGSTIGRSDLLMVAAIDLDTKEATLVSIPRDTYVEIAGSGEYDKINHAYARGVSTSMRTVENYLNIPIDYHISVNFTAFEQFIDMLGGIQLDVERTIHHNIRTDDVYLYPGVQTVNGANALEYVRFRADGEGDFGRNRRQQQVMKEIIDQSTSVRTVTRVPEILNIMGSNVRTDMETGTMLGLVTNLSSLKSDNVESLRLTGESVMINRVSYVKVEEEDRLEVERALQERLKIDFVKVEKPVTDEEDKEDS